GVASLALTACVSQQAKTKAMSMPFVMNQQANLDVQRPRLPNTDAVSWTGADRLYRSVAIDYVQGMSQRSYIFSKPNQQVYVPMLKWSLDRAGLLARNEVEARYALQVEFLDLDAEAIGMDFAGHSSAVYRIVDRASGQAVYENVVNSNFLAIYPRLNEDDFATAYNISKDIVVESTGAFLGYALVEGGLVELINNNDDFRSIFDEDIDEASQATWNDITQAYVWTAGIGALLGPLEVVRQQLDPTNYIAFASSNERTSAPVKGARRGALSEQGYGARSAGKRARQASAQMLAQSLTRFVIDLGQQENVEFVTILPCNANEEVQEQKYNLMVHGLRWYAPDCHLDNDHRTTPGLQYSRFK
ncbi:MAG: hypothetical protein VX593_06270, partial [Pseudomonadota bacterium]|nr:hypothetical protein [Pseudomonadota bacterium]